MELKTVNDIQTRKQG